MLGGLSHKSWRERAGRLGWWLAAVGVLVVLGALVWRALVARDPDFDRLVGWATILGSVVAAVGMAGVFVGRARQRVDTSSDALDAVERDLAAEILDRERKARALLLGTDQKDTAHINLAFYREMIQYSAAGGGLSGDLETIPDYYRSLKPARLVIVGEPGSGKTVLALHLQVRLLEQRDQSSGGDRSAPLGALPVRFSLAGFDTTTSLEQWLAGQVADRFPVSSAVAQALVRDRRILPVLDGLDEMDPEGAPPARATAAVARINEYVQGVARAPVVVACRNERYDQLGSPVLDATRVEISSLTATQIARYLADQLRNADDAAAWAPLIDPLANDPDGPVAHALTITLPTPWRLNLAVTAYRDSKEPLDPLEFLPSSLATHDLREHADQICARLLEKYVPATTRLHPRRDGSHHDDKQVMDQLRTVAQHLASQEQHGLSGSDLILHTWWPVAGFDRVRYSHAALNLVLSCAILACVAWVVFGPPSVWLDNVRIMVTNLPGPDRQFLVGGVLLVIGTLMVLLSATRNWRTWPEPSHPNLRRLQNPRQRRDVLISLVIGLMLGLAIGLVVLVTTGLWSGLVLGLALGPLIGLMQALDTGLVRALEPRDPMRNDLTFGLVLGLALGLVPGALYGLSFGPVAGLVTGLVFAVVGGVHVAAAWVRYVIAQTILAVTRRMPLGFGAFLDWACSAGLMRVSGIAYQFRHRELQAWLTPGDNTPLIPVRADENDQAAT